MRRGRASGAGAVACGQDFWNFIGIDPSLPDLDEGSRHDAYLVHEEAVAFEDEIHLGTPRENLDLVQRPDGILGCALLVAEAAEIVLTEQRPGCGSHGTRVERLQSEAMPAGMAPEGILGSPFAQPVYVALGHGVMAGEEGFGNGKGLHGANIWGKMSVDGSQEAIGLPGAGELNEHPLRSSVNSGIGPARALWHRGLRGDGLDGSPKLPLHTPGRSLDLPPVELGANVGQAQENVERHDLIVGVLGLRALLVDVESPWHRV